MCNEVGQRDRRTVHIAAANVQQPRDAVQGGDNGSILPRSPNRIGHLRALVRAAAPGQCLVMHHGGCGRGGGAIRPHRVDRIAVRRHQRHSLGFYVALQRLRPARRVQPRIVADPRPFRCIGSQPFRHAFTRHDIDIEQPHIDLIAYLDGVASVDEHRRAVLQHNRRPGRPAETGEPGQPLRIAADIFGHVFIAQRHHEAIEIAPLQFLAQGGQAALMGLHQHGVFLRVWCCEAVRLNAVA